MEGGRPPNVLTLVANEMKQPGADRRREISYSDDNQSAAHEKAACAVGAYRRAVLFTHEARDRLRSQDSWRDEGPMEPFSLEEDKRIFVTSWKELPNSAVGT